MSTNLQNSAVATGLEKMSFHSNLKERKCQSMLKLPHNCTHLSSVQSLSRVRLFVTPWIATHQASCPSPTPGVHWDSRPSSQWCQPAISSSVVPFSSCPQSLPASIFSSESTLRIRWPKYWSFSFSIIPSKEIQGWPKPQFKSINSSAFSFLHSPTHSPRARHPGVWSQVGLREHHYEQS